MSNASEPSSVLEWSQLDVFAERRYEGNMLAVFHDGTGLSTEQMLTLARETNLSETTFILPRPEAEELEHGVRVRIFTTQEELPFAGHPTLGTASWLWWNHPRLRGSAEIRLQLNSGTVPVRFQSSGLPEADSVYGEMHQMDPCFEAFTHAAELMDVLGLREDDLHAELRAEVVSTGLPFCIVPLRSVEAMGRLSTDHRRLTPLLHRSGAKFAYCIAPVGSAEGREPAYWRARMQFYNGEDPATGSAAGCAISYLVRHGAAPSGEDVVIKQGIEIHRPSRIDARAALRDGRVQDVVVGGRTIPVATGRFMRP